MKIDSDIAALVESTITKAFNLGKTYWQQADSESYKQNKLSKETFQKYVDLKFETVSKVNIMLMQIASVEDLNEERN